MIKKDRRVHRDGSVKTQIRVVEAYRPGPGLSPKQRTIKSFGYLEDQSNPAAFMEMVAKFDADYKKDETPIRIEVPAHAKMYSPTNRRQNYGYKFLEYVYNQLGISEFIDAYTKSRALRHEYSYGDIFKFLVILRIMSPDSKRSSCQMKDNFYGMNTEFSLQDIYRSLERFSDLSIELQQHMNSSVQALVGRDFSYAFYDVTNYYFEIDMPDDDDGLRKRGVSKEHRVDPIVAMGLFMDANGLPVSMSLFPGNTSDSLTVRPMLAEVRKHYGFGRMIVVGDKGINSSKNIAEIVHNGDGYVFSQILKGKKGQRYHDKLFDNEGYVENIDKTYRYKLFQEDYEVITPDGKREQFKRNVLIYWSKADADIAKRKRDEKLQKAERAVKNAAYGIKKGIDEYTRENIIDRDTGEFISNVKRLRAVDIEKATDDARFDGYFCIITSEIEYKENKIREVYGSLWRIEQSFRIMKSDLYARPVFVRKSKHIEAHFLICFTALLVVRVLQYYMGKRKQTLSVERIAKALNLANCQVLKGGILHLDDVGGAIAFQKKATASGETIDLLSYSDQDEIAQDYEIIQNTFGTKFYDVYPRQEDFNKFLKNIRLA